MDVDMGDVEMVDEQQMRNTHLYHELQRHPAKLSKGTFAIDPAKLYSVADHDMDDVEMVDEQQMIETVLEHIDVTVRRNIHLYHELKRHPAKMSSPFNIDSAKLNNHKAAFFTDPAKLNSSAADRDKAAFAIDQACAAARLYGTRLDSRALMPGCAWLEDAALWLADFQRDALRRLLPADLVPREHLRRTVRVLIDSHHDRALIPAFILARMPACVWRGHMLLSKYALNTDANALIRLLFREIAHEAVFGEWDDMGTSQAELGSQLSKRVYIESCIIALSQPLLLNVTYTLTFACQGLLSTSCTSDLAKKTPGTKDTSYVSLYQRTLSNVQDSSRIVSVLRYALPSSVHIFLG